MFSSIFDLSSCLFEKSILHNYEQIHIISACRRRCSLWHTVALLPGVPRCMGRSDGKRNDPLQYQTLGKTAFLTIKTARTGNVSSGRLLSQDLCFFRLLTVRRRKTQTVGKYRFQQLVGECFCAVGIEKQLRNNGLPVPLCRDNSVRLNQRSGCSFLFCQ